MISSIEKETSYSIDLVKSNQNNYENSNYCEELLPKRTTPYNNNVALNINELIVTTNNIQEEHESRNINNNDMELPQELNISLHRSSDNDGKTVENFNEEINIRNLSIQNNLQFSKIQKCVVDPLNICETVLSSEDIFESEISGSFKANRCRSGISQDNINISYYFTNMDNSINKENLNKANDMRTPNDMLNLDIDKINQITDPAQDKLNKFELPDTDCIKNVVATDFRYNFNNRLRFVPKGMSPIFTNCNTKYACDYRLDEDYYENSLYNNFINEIHTNFETFNPLIQNIKELNTKFNDNIQTKVHKDNAALKFNGRSLKEAKVFGQIDDKFIASILKSKNNEDKEDAFIVLFDQHAVHERIRTEKNLSDYTKDQRWKSVEHEVINMILTIEDVMYLHNYKEKFSELGLQFTIISSQEILINAVPEAILGKIPREHDKIVKAVKNLIAEEINVIKTQSGCISFYPKSIMDLVFSEACRYAIKFGDRLTKNECLKLIKDLSECKTPFQCAHGRPVMAVIVNINNNNEEYKVDFNKLKLFKNAIQNNV